MRVSICTNTCACVGACTCIPRTLHGLNRCLDDLALINESAMTLRISRADTSITWITEQQVKTSQSHSLPHPHERRQPPAPHRWWPLGMPEIHKLQLTITILDKLSSPFSSPFSFSLWRWRTEIGVGNEFRYKCKRFPAAEIIAELRWSTDFPGAQMRFAFHYTRGVEWVNWLDDLFEWVSLALVLGPGESQGIPKEETRTSLKPSKQEYDHIPSK